MPSQQQRVVVGRKAVYFPYILDEIQKIVQFVQLPTPRPAQQPPPHCTAQQPAFIFFVHSTFAKERVCFYAQHTLEDGLDAVNHMLAHFPILKTDATRAGNEPLRSLKFYNRREGPKCLTSVLHVKPLVGTFDQEKAIAGAFSVIVKLQTSQRSDSSTRCD